MAILDGRLADAEDLDRELDDVHRRTAVAATDSGRVMAHIALRREQDRLTELVPPLTPDDEESAPAGLPHAARAFVLVETGHHDDAAILLHRADQTGWAAVPDDLHWPATVALWSEVAARIGDRHAAAALHPILQPHDGTLMGSGPVGCGPASRLLALLETLLGRPAEADRHFAQAVAFSRGLMSPVWVARCLLDWAHIVFERGETPGRRN